MNERTEEYLVGRLVELESKIVIERNELREDVRTANGRGDSLAGELERVSGRLTAAQQRNLELQDRIEHLTTELGHYRAGRLRSDGTRRVRRGPRARPQHRRDWR